MARAVEKQIRKARDKLSKSIPISKYIRDNKLGYADEGVGVILCPVHDENTPSFRYDDSKMRCHCFGCGVKGTVVELNYRINKDKNDRYTMIRSIKDLAKKYDVEIPDLYEQTIDEVKDRKKSRRRRGTKGRQNEWIYVEKLKRMEGSFLGLPYKSRLKIVRLIDGVWLGKTTARKAYDEIQKIVQAERKKIRGE